MSTDFAAMLVQVARLAVHVRFPEAAREQRRLNRQRQRQAARQRQRKQGTAMASTNKPLEAVPADNNQPHESSRCPRCCVETGFRWIAKERTWRCCGCRVPLRFREGQPSLNFHRGMNSAPQDGWRIPDRTVEIQNCIRLLGTKLFDVPRPVVEIRAEMKRDGFNRKLVDEAVRLLRIRQQQIERPGPVYFILPPTSQDRVAYWMGKLARSLVEDFNSPEAHDNESGTKSEGDDKCAEN